MPGYNDYETGKAWCILLGKRDLEVEMTTETKKTGPPIEVYEEKCTGCLICELRCSLRLEKAFNPAKARIRIRRLVNADTEYAVSLTEDCDNCGICVRHCPYDALYQEKRKGGR